MSPGGLVSRIESGVPIKTLAGIHPGCFELFVHEQIKSVEDLKGKQVGLDDSRSRDPWPVRVVHRRQRRARPGEGHPLGHPGRRRRSRPAVHGRQDRRLHGVHAAGDGAARAQGRPGPGRSGAGPSPGRKPSAAWRSAIPTSSRTTRSRPSARCAPCSRRPTCARTSPRRLRSCWSRTASLRTMIKRSACSPTCATTPGARSTPSTRCVSTPSSLQKLGQLKTNPETVVAQGSRLAVPQRTQARIEGVSARNA